VVYYRVTDARSEPPELQLSSQEIAVETLVRGRGWTLAGAFTEVEHRGRRADARGRPEFEKAIALALRVDAALVVARLGRLARDLACLGAIQKAGVEFFAADLPTVTAASLPTMIALAEHEWLMRSAQIREALATSKASGKVLGANGKVLALRNKQDAISRLAPVAALIRDLRRSGKSVRAIAEHLNAEGISSPGGGRWHPSSVQAAIYRIVSIQDDEAHLAGRILRAADDEDDRE
jgi:DNA invertase Pin-like site-specific DNA recombinase